MRSRIAQNMKVWEKLNQLIVTLLKQPLKYKTEGFLIGFCFLWVSCLPPIPVSPAEFGVAPCRSTPSFPRGTFWCGGICCGEFPFPSCGAPAAPLGWGQPLTSPAAAPTPAGVQVSARPSLRPCPDKADLGVSAESSKPHKCVVVALSPFPNPHQCHKVHNWLKLRHHWDRFGVSHISVFLGNFAFSLLNILGKSLVCASASWAETFEVQSLQRILPILPLPHWSQLHIPGTLPHGEHPPLLLPLPGAPAAMVGSGVGWLGWTRLCTALPTAPASAQGWETSVPKASFMLKVSPTPWILMSIKSVTQLKFHFTLKTWFGFTSTHGVFVKVLNNWFKGWKHSSALAEV